MNLGSITGQCFCGHIQFELTGAPTFACHCHCESCQRASGAGFVTWVTFAASDFRILKGTLAEYRSSPGVIRGHCAECGTSISYAHEQRAEDIDITATSFDDPSFVVPQAHIWLEDKQTWDQVDDGLPKYERRVTQTA